MERMEGKRNRRGRGHGALVCLVGVLCLVYLFTTRTPEAWRLIEAFEGYCYAHYVAVANPTEENQYRFMRFEEKLARASKGKFDHRNPEEVRAFLGPRGYAYDVDEGDGRVDYLLASFVEDGHFEASGPGSESYHYFMLDRIYVYPYGRVISIGFPRKRDRSPMILSSRNGFLYLDGEWVKQVFTKLFNRLWESKVTGISKTKIPRSYKILYRGVEEIWREARLFYFSEKATKEYFVENAFEYSIPVILECVSMEQYYRKLEVIGTDGLELSYLRSLTEEPSFITLGLLCYLSENSGNSWARNVINSLEAEGLRELGLENCSLEQIRRAARKAFEWKREDLA
ncbi:MAG: hypothetical protein ACE5I8_07060 [Thermodesulfobacteriota bacterium]